MLKYIKENKKLKKDLEVLISELSIEELISMKLELVYKSLNNKLYGFPIWKNVDQIIRDSLIKFAVRNTTSLKDAAAILNVRTSQLKTFIYKYGLEEDFSKKEDSTT